MQATLLLLKATSLLGAALLLVRLMGRANPRWRMLACEAAALGVILLPLLSLAPIRIPLPGGQPEEPVVHAASDSPASGGQAQIPAGGPGLLEPASAPRKAVPAATADPGAGGPRLRFSDWAAGLLAAVYGTALLALLARQLRSARRLRWSLASLAPAGSELSRRAEDLAAGFGLAPAPRLLVARTRTTPFACGLRQRTIVIPETLTEPEQAAALDLALRHELHHHANRDLHRALFMQLVATALWFHPLAWLLKRSHSLAAEELGDRVAAEVSGTARYSSVLAKLALSLRPERDFAASAMTWLHTPEVITRLRRLQEPVPHGRLPRASRCFALGAVALPIVGALASIGVAHPVERADREFEHASRFAALLPEPERRLADVTRHRVMNFLLARQREDGSFRREKETGSGFETALTALAGMAFYAHGGMHPGSPYHRSLRRCLDSVYVAQAEDGLFRDPGENAGSVYSHSIATWFVANVGAKLDKDPARAEHTLRRAVEVLLRSQAVEKPEAARGGWRYRPDAKDSDLSVTAWALRALLAAKAAGHQVPDDAIEDGMQYVLRLQNERDGGFSYLASGTGSNLPRTGMALYLLERTRRGATAEGGRAASYVMEHADDHEGAYPYYGMFWCASAMAARGGENASRYASRLFRECAVRQQEDGSFASSLGPLIASLSAALAMAPPD